MNEELKTLRENYSGMSDERIYGIVENNILRLTADALQVLREEVVKRELPLLSKIDHTLKQQRKHTCAIERKSEELRNLPCPICKSEEYKLNAVNIRTVIGLITTTRIKDEFHFGCYNCLNKAKLRAENTTSLFGWWSIRGMFITHQALKANDKAIQDLALDKPTGHLKSYAYTILSEEEWEDSIEDDSEKTEIEVLAPPPGYDPDSFVIIPSPILETQSLKGTAYSWIWNYIRGRR